MEKVTFSTPTDGLNDGAPEVMWAEKLSPESPYILQLQNTPFYAKGVSYLDVIQTATVDGALVYEKTLSASGHSTYRILVTKNSTSFGRLWKELEELGCTYESSDESRNRLYAVDVPAECDVFRVYSILEAGEDEGVWQFDEGHCGHLAIRQPH